VKLLLDQGLPRSVAGLLREAGIDTIHVGEIGYSTADDAMILQKGRDLGTGESTSHVYERCLLIKGYLSG
jgi:predicted nuclease of predicted toxin-antitoxin system